VPEEVVREPVGKTVLKNSGTSQNVLVLFQNFKIKMEKFCFCFKNFGTHNIFIF
jgi:hypothetical protein